MTLLVIAVLLVLVGGAWVATEAMLHRLYRARFDLRWWAPPLALAVGLCVTAFAVVGLLLCAPRP